MNNTKKKGEDAGTLRQVKSHPSFWINKSGEVFQSRNGNMKKVPSRIRDLGYEVVTFAGKQHFVHRLLAQAFLQPTSEPYLVDHINRIKTDNRLSNLRVCDNRLNLMNRGANANNTSGFKGVRFREGSGRWQANLEFEGRSFCLGTFDCKEDAARAYDSLCALKAGSFAWFNFPEDDHSRELLLHEKGGEDLDNEVERILKLGKKKTQKQCSVCGGPKGTKGNATLCGRCYLRNRRNNNKK